MAVAHVNLGLVYMLKMENYHRYQKSIFLHLNCRMKCPDNTLIYKIHVISCNDLIDFRAIKKFSGAIKADPTYLKAYVCRAEAFTKIHDVSNSFINSQHC